jgi:elongation factor 1-beta
MPEKKDEPHFVIAIIKVLPDDVYNDKEMEALKKKIVTVLKPLNTVVEASQLEEVAYGLRAFKMRIKIPEETQGGTEPIEEAIQTVEGIQRAEVEMVSRL